MLIKIAQRYKPYSHTMEIFVLIPKTNKSILVFPTCLQFEDQQISFSLQGPFKDFTCQQDLERGSILIYGKSRQGFFRFEIKVKEGKIVLLIKKVPPHIFYILNDIEKPLLSKQEVVLPLVSTVYEKQTQERLFLGCSKAQDWDLILRREEASEIFPFWHKLAAFIPSIEKTDPFFEECEDLILKKKKQEALYFLKNCFLQGFKDLLHPTVEDHKKQKLFSAFAHDPLLIVSKGRELIRKLFFQYKQNELYLLPCLPSSFICGKMTDVFIEDIGVLDFEWSKGFLRRMVLRSHTKRTLQFVLQRELKSFRFQKDKRESGEKTLFLEKNEVYYFDRFEK